MVIDFRKLNDRTIPDRYPMRNISMILANLRKAKFFTTLDLKSGYHQIYLAVHDREKTAFSVNGGKSEFFRPLFGFKNASSIFQRATKFLLSLMKLNATHLKDHTIFWNQKKSYSRTVTLKSPLTSPQIRLPVGLVRFYPRRVDQSP